MEFRMSRYSKNYVILIGCVIIAQEHDEDRPIARIYSNKTFDLLAEYKEAYTYIRGKWIMINCLCCENEEYYERLRLTTGRSSHLPFSRRSRFGKKLKPEWGPDLKFGNIRTQMYLILKAAGLPRLVVHNLIKKVMVFYNELFY